MRKLSRYKLLTCLAIVGMTTVLALLALLPPQSTRKTPIPTKQRGLISPSSYKFVLNEPEICEKKSPFLVLLVPVTLKDTEARTAIRKTWGRGDLLPNVSVLRLFVLGQPRQSDRRLQEHLERESEEHGDVIQMDFVDSYQNLTIKTMMIMNWVAVHCQSSRYAMKIDADIFLNVHYLVDYLMAQGESSRENFITGSVIRDGRPNRDSFNKWYLSEELYPDTWYPPYVSGAAYVFSSDLARKISWASRVVPPVPLEDVYVGLCLNVLGVRPIYATASLGLRNLFEVRKMKYDRCTFARRIIVNGFKPQELLGIWHDFQKSRHTC